MKKHKICGIVPDSIADELEIKVNQYLLTVNGETVRDIFDYQFLINDEYIEFEIEDEDGNIDFYEIEKDFSEDIGLIFDNSLMDEYHSCANKCIFCFIDQMPKGMRDTLYFKDDDSRLSFLQGNYVTLTNMSEADIDRIIRYHMEPINISIHTTNPELRCKMLGNRFAGDVLKYIDKLNEAGVKMNGQIVLCKGINDGAELERTLSDLEKYVPNMQSVSIVPVGLTKYRDGLFNLEPITKEDAIKVIDLVEKEQEKIYNKHGINFIHASDEFYLLAGRMLPSEEKYDGYLQLENGVGMLRLLKEEFADALDSFIEKNEVVSNRNFTVVTGVLSADSIKEMLNETSKMLEENNLSINNKFNCIAIKNNFFGEQITVSGLVCGQDILAQLKDIDLGDEILLPVNMFRYGEEYLLDDVTKLELEKELGVKVTIVNISGYSLLNAIIGKPDNDFRRQIYEQADGGNCWQA